VTDLCPPLQVKVLSRHLLRRTKQETIGHLMRGKADNVVFCKMSDVQTRVYRRLLQSPDFQLLISKDLPCTCGSHLTRVECCHRTAPDGVIWSYLHQEDPDGCDWCPYCIVLPCLTKLQQVGDDLLDQLALTQVCCNLSSFGAICSCPQHLQFCLQPNTAT